MRRVTSACFIFWIYFAFSSGFETTIEPTIEFAAFGKYKAHLFYKIIELTCVYKV